MFCTVNDVFLFAERRLCTVMYVKMSVDDQSEKRRLRYK